MIPVFIHKMHQIITKIFQLSHAWGKKYGRRGKVNDIVDTKVDFNKFTLSLRNNQTDYGNAFDIKPGE